MAIRISSWESSLSLQCCLIWRGPISGAAGAFAEGEENLSQANPCTAAAHLTGVLYVIHVYAVEKSPKLRLDQCLDCVQREVPRLGPALFPFLQGALRYSQLQSCFALRKIVLFSPFVEPLTKGNRQK